MEAGRLSHRIVIEAPNRAAANEYGERTQGWQTLAARPDGVYAEVRPVSGRETQTAMRFVPTVSHVITIRYVDGVTTSHRAKFGTRTFAINAVIDPDERRVELRLYCTEVV